ncbi:MAG: hypothetical protein QE509_00240 [Gammaproteobacteria bacterium]|jgi:hypothetical protein|nr:hypothetical protein [Gammaproteobacteria bacterium]
MGTSMMSEGWNALVDELKTLEAFFPLLGSPGEQDEVLEEIAELEELIAAAGIPEDEHSQRALAFLHEELARKRRLLERV